MCNHKIVSTTKNFQDQIWERDHAIRGDRLWSFTKQRAGTGALSALYTAELPVALGITIATYADDIAILAAHNNDIKAFLRLQGSLFYIQKWLKKWGKICTGDIPQRDVPNSENPSCREDAKYLRLHLDRRLYRKRHVFIKRKLGIQLSKMYWLLGNKSQVDRK